MNKLSKLVSLLITITLLFSCSSQHMNSKKSVEITAKDILGNANYQAICYGGFREKTRDIEPTISQITEDLKILKN